MADNIQVKDGNGNLLYLQTGDNAGVHTPVHRVSDGTNYQPVMDTVGRAAFVKLTDGTDTALVTAAGEQNVIDAATQVDDAAFTPATGKVHMIGALADESATDSVDEGDGGALRMTLNRRLIIAGNQLDDAAFSVGADYVTSCGYLADESATDSVDEGDVGVARMTLDRRVITAGQILDDAAFGIGTGYVTPAAFLADESATDSVNEGDVGVARMTLDRRIIMASQVLDDAAFGVGTEYVTAAGFLADEGSTDSVDEGDVGAPRMTLNRRIITAGQMLDDAAFTPGSDYGTPASFLADETATDSVDEGDSGVARMTLDRKQIVATYAHTAGGCSAYSFLSTGAVQAVEIKGSPGQIYSMQFFNLNAAARYVRLYNQTGAPAGGDNANIIWRGMIPGNTAGAGFVVEFPNGLTFSTGIGIRVTGAVGDTDTTVLSANENMGSVQYK